LPEAHEPVLCEETTRMLAAAGPGIYVDATLGAGGHAASLLERNEDARLIGIDRDPAALELARERLQPFGERVFFCMATFSSWRTCSGATLPRVYGGS
jgi:16S rRNA (cytosine1402-N4)-methyltransferase